jgi:DNA-binding transcriptional MerR regulator
MSHEIAKLLLEHAETFLERTEAIKAALSLGMPLNEIQDYLDWLDTLRGSGQKKSPGSRPATGSPTPSPRPTNSGGNEAADSPR